MKLREVTLDGRDLPSLHEFYAGDLALPVVRRTADALTFQAGATALTFRRAERSASYHFAFNVHPARFERARAIVAAITPLLHDADGQEIFDFRSWDARACYFYDPAGNVVEIIARRDLASLPIHPEPAILSVGELGLVADDVPALAARITRDLGLPVYRESSGETFAALGDAEGLLILSQRGRIWYPDTGKASAPAPVVCVLQHGGQSWRIQGPPFQFTRISK